MARFFCNPLLPLRYLFVSGSAVHPGHWNVVSSEADAQAGAMANHVVDDASGRGQTRHGEKRRAAPRQRPHAPHVFVLGLGDRFSRGRDVSLKKLKDVRPAGQLWELVRLAADRSDVQMTAS
jgi:hypothetical protein